MVQRYFYHLPMVTSERLPIK